LASDAIPPPDPPGGVETERTKRLKEVERGKPNAGSVLPLLDLMAANHAVRLGMEIPPTLVRAMDHRHGVLARRYPNAARMPKDARRRLLAGMPKPPAEAVAQHEAEWLVRARDVIARYDSSPAGATIQT
jgi:hypothetical protein